MEDPCEIKAIHKTIAEEEKRTTQITFLAISGLNCPNCAIRVRNAFLNTYGVTDAIIDHAAGLGEIIYNPNLVERSSLPEIVSKAGGDGIHSYSARILE
jgi:copper chaperone CopZ